MTLQQLIDQAAFKLGAIESGSSASTAETADMLRELNQMLSEWKQNDKDLQWPPQDTASDTYPLQMWTESAVVHNLAVRGATIFNVAVPPDVAFMANEGQKFIAKTLINNDLLPKDMSHLPAGGGRWNIITDSKR